MDTRTDTLDPARTTLRLVPELAPLLAQVDLGPLAREEEALASLAADYGRDRRAAASLRGSDGAAASELRAQVWRTLAAWMEVRAQGDAGADPERIGNWSLTELERAWVDGGLVHPWLYDSTRGDAEAVEAVAALLRPSTNSNLEISTLSATLLEHFRRDLAIEDEIRARHERGALRDRIERSRAEIAKLTGAVRVFLDGVDDARPLLPLQSQLEDLFPHLAHLARLARQGGVEPGDHRLQMKVREASQRLYLKIHDAISVYAQRKEYESQHKEIVRRWMEQQDLEESAAESERKRAPESERFAPDRLLASARRAVEEARHKMRLVARCAAGEPPPFLLEHEPRLTPEVVDAKWRELLTACPRFAAAQLRDSGRRPRVHLLPGSGNPMLEPGTGAVLASVFPIEVHLVSIGLTLGESYLMADRELVESLAAFLRTSAQDDVKLRDEFRRLLQAWIEQGAGGRPLDRSADKWLRQNLLLARAASR